MVSFARERKPVKPATGTCSLALTINGVAYKVRPLPRADGTGAAKAFRLVKQGGKGDVYDVLVHRDGHAECDCPDAIYRRNGLDAAGCKHVKAARAVGLI